ncbi:TPA: DUF1372 family protein [Streptococcus suis]
MVMLVLTFAISMSVIYKLKKQVEQLEARKPVIIYQVDNAGGVMIGQITDKEIIEGRYTVTAHAYGKFLVTREQYEAIKVGDPIPEYLKGRGD